MREALKNLSSDKRHAFTGVFVRTGVKQGYHGLQETVLIKNIRDTDGKLITDHVWFNSNKEFKDLSLQENDIVKFTAKVSTYIKGYMGKKSYISKSLELDYRLESPCGLKLLRRAKIQNKVV